MLTLRGGPLAAMLLWLVITPQASADDLAPPPYRDQPHSVMAKFELFGGQQPGPPETFNAVPGIYPLDRQTQPMIGAGQTDPITNELIYPIQLPNFIDPLPLKRMRIQYSWFGSVTGNPGDAAAFNIVASPSGSVQLVNSTLPQLIPGTNNIYHRWDDYELRPNPDWERLEVAFSDADPRWVIIDTISIPEPTAAVLLLMGLPLLTRRR